ncbi:unnamed protein product, partial [Nesidiocoris tenuis]
MDMGIRLGNANKIYRVQPRRHLDQSEQCIPLIPCLYHLGQNRPQHCRLLFFRNSDHGHGSTAPFYRIKKVYSIWPKIELSIGRMLPLKRRCTNS